MNDPSQHEIDDELLSAYLDDELSAEERARVESRLATDPTARKTLEHLRSVSQSVRDLPSERLPHDLRASILQRIEATRAARPELAKGVATSSTQPPARGSTKLAEVSSLPHVTIGRTTRGWIWAAAAIAAAVLIMVLQPGEQQDADLPSIAKRDEPGAEHAAATKQPLNRGQQAADVATNEPVPAPLFSEQPSSNATAPDQPALKTPADVEASSASEQNMKARRGTSDSLATSAPSGAVQKVPAAEAPAAPAFATGKVADQPVVVRVLARPAAVKNKAFEALLRKNQVDFDSNGVQLGVESATTVGESAKVVADRLEALPADAPRSKDTEGEVEAKKIERLQAPQEEEQVEFVLVDAPSRTILSCMNELNNDDANYSGIAVEGAGDASKLDKAAVTAKPAENRQLAELQKFNRGVVPPFPARRWGAENYYYNLGTDDHRWYGKQRFSSGAGGFGGGRPEESVASGDKQVSERGRARKLQLQVDDVANRNSSVNDAFGVNALSDVKQTPQTPAAQPSLPAKSDPDRMQVLFVIAPGDEPAPTLKAKNQPQ